MSGRVLINVPLSSAIRDNSLTIERAREEALEKYLQTSRIAASHLELILKVAEGIRKKSPETFANVQADHQDLVESHAINTRRLYSLWEGRENDLAKILEERINSPAVLHKERSDRILQRLLEGYDDSLLGIRLISQD